MARSRETKIELTAYDDLFQTDESRAEAKLSKIRDIPISEIDEFPDHPFKVLMDEDMEQLVESIKRNGVMTPATVRLKEDGRYELISGHRRKKACELVNHSQVSRHKKAHFFRGAGYFVCSQYKASASFGVSILSVPCGLFVL